MTKNLKLSFFISLIFSAIMIAWNTLTRFFSGVGINFVAMLTILGVLLYFILSDKATKSRIMDIFILVVVFTVLEFLVFVVFEFSSSIKAMEKFADFQIFLSIMGMLLMAYVAFRFIMEAKGVKIGFVEMILGNGNSQKKVKANKELVNGSLEEKPNHKSQDELEEKEEPAEEVIEVTEEE